MSKNLEVSINFCKPTLRGVVGSQPEQSWFVQKMLSRRFSLQYEEKPDFLVFGELPSGAHLHYPSNTIRIFVTGENVSANWNEADYGLTHQRLYSERHWRVPVWRHSYDTDGTPPMRDFSVAKRKVERFCNFIYSNDKAKERIAFFELLDKYKRVDSGGKVRNNLGYRVEDKMDFISRCKFTIAFENESSEGYSTEKIIQPLSHGSIPIYWGDTSIERDFNPDCLINVHQFKNFEAVVERIIQIDQDDNLWKKYVTAPIFANNRIPDELSDKAILDFLETTFERRRGFVLRHQKIQQRLNHSFSTLAGTSFQLYRQARKTTGRWRRIALRQPIP